MRRVRCIAFAATVLLLGLAARNAGAIALPDSSSCSTTGANGCLRITNTTASGGSVSIYGDGSTASIGVQGTSNGSHGVYGFSNASTGYGVYAIGYGSSGGGLLGASTGGVGLYASSNSNDAIHAVAISNVRSGLYAQNLTTGGGGYGVYGSAGGTGQGIHGENPDSSGWAGYFNGKVYAASGFTSSDARLKKEIAELPYGLTQALALRPVTFKWKDERRGQGRQVGLIAQEIQKVVPEIVDEDAKSGMLSVNYPALVPVLIKAVQEQQKVIQRQDERIARLEQRPVFSSLVSGGLDRTIAIASVVAFAFMVIRRRRQQQK